MTTEAVILTGVTLYLLAMLAVGYLAAGKTRSVSEFIVAGRGLSVWLLATTVIATWFGGVAIMGFAGTAYDEGLFGVIADPFGGALALVLIGLFFARLFRRLRIMTVADFMEQRFGTVAAMAITAVQLFANVLWVGAMLVAFGLVAEQLTGLPMEVGIVAGAVVIFFYTAIGGMWAVAMTDFVQMLIVFAGLVVLFVVVLVDVGGWGAVAPQLPEGSFRMLPLDHSWETWLNYLRAWTIIGLVDISAQSLVQRVAAARTERVAQNAFYLGAAGYLVFGMIPVLLGMIGSVTMPDLASPESVVPALAIQHLHPVAIAIFVGAVLAAIMSSADSVLLACASLLARNVLPLVKRDPPPRLALLVARLSIPVFGSVAIVIAINIRDVYDLMVNANMLGLAAIIVPFVLGVWWRKANRTGALAAMAVGIVAWLVTLFVAPSLPADFVGLAASLITMLVITPLTQRFDPPRALRDADGERVDLQDRLGTLSPFGKD